MAFSSRVVFIAMVLLAAPMASQGQCDLPTVQEVEDVYRIVLETGGVEGGSDLVVNLTQVHFTCLARVALYKYTWATVVISFTTNTMASPQIEQFQLRCVSNTWGADPGSLFDLSVPSMPFDIVTQENCSSCAGSSSSPNYDADSNCVRKYV